MTATRMRVAAPSAFLRGRPDARMGVVAKAPKPMQERRVDLPVIVEGVDDVDGHVRMVREL